MMKISFKIIAVNFAFEKNLIGLKSARNTASGGTNRTEINGRTVNKTEMMPPNKIPSAIARYEIAKSSLSGI